MADVRNLADYRRLRPVAKARTDVLAVDATIKIEGDVELNIDIGFAEGQTQEQNVATGMSTTGFHLVNSVHLICEAKNPGIKTFLDLPMITGVMGTHVAQRYIGN